MYGLYGKIYNYVGLFVFLADLWLYTIAIREITSNKQDSEKIIGNIMTLRWVLGVLILFFALILAYFLPGYNSDVALWAIFFGSLFTIFQLFNSSIMSLMQANMKMEFSLFSTVIGKLINIWLVMMIAFVWFINPLSSSDYSMAFIAIIIASLIWVIVNTVLNFYYANKLTPIRFYYDRVYIIQLFKTSLPYGIALFLSIVYFKIDIILLSLIEGPGKGDISIALYSLPMKIVEVVMVMWGFYLNSILPFLSQYFQKKDMASLEKLVQNSFYILFSTAIWICSLWVLFRENIILIIANEQYLSSDYAFHSADVFIIVFGVIVFYFISLLCIYLLIAFNQQSQLLKINIFVTIINIIGNIILIPHYSFMGAAVMTLISQIVLLFLSVIALKNQVSFWLHPGSIIWIILGGAGMYWWGITLLSYISFGIYGDTLLVWSLLLWLYSMIIYYFLFQKYIYTYKKD